MNNKSDKLLIGSKAIRAYLHDISEPVFKKFLKMGMPVIVIDNRYYASTDNLDEYFKSVNLGRITDIPEYAE